jgi:hypothetical protein
VADDVAIVIPMLNEARRRALTRDPDHPSSSIVN